MEKIEAQVGAFVFQIKDRGKGYGGIRYSIEIEKVGPGGRRAFAQCVQTQSTEEVRALRDALTKALGEEAITLIVDGPRPGTWNNLGDCAQALVGRACHEVKMMRDTCIVLLGR